MIHRDAKDWITVRNALVRFRISRATLYRLIGTGQVARAKRVGDVQAYVSVPDLKRATALQVRPPTAKTESDDDR